MGRPLDEDIIIKILERWQKAFKENSHYVSASDLSLVIKDVRELPTIQPVATDTNVGDTISRQAAIDAIDKRFDNIPMEQTAEILMLRKDLRELPTIQPVATDTNVGNKISKFIDGLEEIFADLRERHVDDSVCGLCEYDGAYMGQSGDWCNECPGFERDDCFKLSDKTRKEWTDEIIKALPTIQPEPHWIPVSERLPEDTQYVLLTVRRLNNAYNSTPFISVGYIGWNQHHWWCAHDGDCEISNVEVLAWMPLPEAYKPNK